MDLFGDVSGFVDWGGTAGAGLIGCEGCSGADGRALFGFVGDVGDPFSNGLNPNPAQTADKEKKVPTRNIKKAFISNILTDIEKKCYLTLFCSKSLFQSTRRIL